MQRSFRLRRNADFVRVRAEGRVWRHPFLMLSAVANGLDHNRYGFVTSRQLGGAVIRNRVRRLMREAVRLSAPQVASGYDLVLIARNESVGQSYMDIKATLEQLFKRAKLWQEVSKS